MENRKSLGFKFKKLSKIIILIFKYKNLNTLINPKSISIVKFDQTFKNKHPVDYR